MSIEALVCRVKTRPMEGMTKIQLGQAAGYQVIVGKDVADDTLGIFFPPGCQLSEEMCYENSLYRAGKGMNANPDANGYLEESRRVKQIKMKGALSEGLWMELKSVGWTGVDLSTLTEGLAFTALEGKTILTRYVSPAQARAEAKEKQPKAGTSGKPKVPAFHEHFDTAQLRYVIGSIPLGARLIITGKCHGTSGRTGHHQVHQPIPLTGFPKLWNEWMDWLGWKWAYRYKTGQDQTQWEQVWKKVSGTRRTILNPEVPDWYHGGNFRREIHDSLSPRKGETLYYEIVGWTGPTGSAIQHGVSLTGDDAVKKTLRKQYGDYMNWSYGCKPGEFKILVYRITYTNVDGEVVELSWDQIKARCRALGLQTVPEILVIKNYTGNSDKLIEACREYTAMPDPLDPSHISEGVCIRVESEQQFGRILKFKGDLFCYLEGMLRELPDFVDNEEIS